MNPTFSLIMKLQKRKESKFLDMLVFCKGKEHRTDSDLVFHNGVLQHLDFLSFTAVVTLGQPLLNP